MTPEQIFTVIAALLSGTPDPDFDRLRAGGFDDRYPVTVEACELPPGTLEVEGRTVLCGTVSVPENYASPEGRRVPLEFAIMKARTQSPAPNPLVYLHGGPGGGTLQALGPVGDLLFSNHRQTRDIVTFDQRAAALSSRTVACFKGMAEHIVELIGVTVKKLDKSALNQMIVPCIEEIKATDADLSAYNTVNNAHDVRALVSALGYPVYNIYGISYGTKLALEVLRTEPEGVRSVVIDGVAPPQVYLYDDLVGPYADTIDALVAQCDAQEECRTAYPELGSTINAAFIRLLESPIPAARGRPEIGFLSLFELIFKDRNNWRDQRDITRWLPRIIAELAQGRSDTFDMLQSSVPPDRVKVLSESKGLTEDERALIRVSLEAAEAMGDLEQAVAAAIERLKRDLGDNREVTSIAEAFENRSTQAALAITDDDARAALLRDYALLQTMVPGRGPLIDWVMAHFDGADRNALLQLIAAMTDADIDRTFDIARGQVNKYEAVLGGVINQAIYACQEDVPYNSLEGFKARVGELAQRYPFLRAFGGETSFYKTCESFEKHPRPGFQSPVISDVPVLAFNGLRDIQTSWRWGAVAVETLPNGRNYVVPEAGHGAIAYQQCPNDISVAFVNDPTAELDTSCIDGITVKFVMPDEPAP
ncbi:MAG: alpha/beta fold hydrolase [Rhizobiaceae bacterium]